eukprot:11187413-Lingulodinium_polyedra.AAC.1
MFPVPATPTVGVRREPRGRDGSCLASGGCREPHPRPHGGPCPELGRPAAGFARVLRVCVQRGQELCDRGAARD